MSDFQFRLLGLAQVTISGWWDPAPPCVQRRSLLENLLLPLPVARPTLHIQADAHVCSLSLPNKQNLQKKVELQPSREEHPNVNGEPETKRQKPVS